MELDILIASLTLAVVLMIPCFLGGGEGGQAEGKKIGFNFIQTFVGQSLKAQYHKINAFLTANVKVDNPKENMRKAGEWLASMSKKLNAQTRPLVEALEQFTALSKLKKRERCDKEVFEVLAKNSVAIGDVMKQSSQNALRRIDKVIAHYISKIVPKCSFTTDGLYDLYHKADMALNGRLEKLLNDIILWALDVEKVNVQAIGDESWESDDEEEEESVKFTKSSESNIEASNEERLEVNS